MRHRSTPVPVELLVFAVISDGIRLAPLMLRSDGRRCHGTFDSARYRMTPMAQARE
jgi:hypothetical protein